MGALPKKTLHGEIHSLKNDGKGFRKLSVLLKSLTGIHLQDSEKNRALMAARLWQPMQATGLEDFSSLAAYLQSGRPAARQHFIELMTTNKTDFFRESAHFDFLKKNLPELQAAKIARGDADFRIWCSATSTGQEPYSILMAYQEALRENERLPLRFLATDIDTRALLTARKGVYDPEQLRHIPPHSKTAWFSTIPTGRTTKYRVKAGLRNRIRFAPFNLVDANQYSFEGKFDVIFCRNVLIYFDEATVDKVIHNLLRFLNRDGFLILGLSEAIREIPPSVKLIGNSIYRKL